MACLGLGGVLAPPPADAINIVLVWDDLDENPTIDPDGTRLMAIAEAAAARWERLIPSAGTHIVDVSWSDLGEDQLGLWKFDPFGNNNVYFDSSTGSDWFIDATPNSESEFDFGDPLDLTSRQLPRGRGPERPLSRARPAGSARALEISYGGRDQRRSRSDSTCRS
jgi:hypothetical protein